MRWKLSIDKKMLTINERLSNDSQTESLTAVEMKFVVFVIIAIGVVWNGVKNYFKEFVFAKL